MALLFFKIFSMRINLVLHVFEPISEALFRPNLTYTPKTCGVNLSTAS